MTEHYEYAHIVVDETTFEDVAAGRCPNCHRQAQAHCPPEKSGMGKCRWWKCNPCRLYGDLHKFVVVLRP